MKIQLNTPWHSSYEENSYGDFFYALMRIYQPEKVVELGTKAGYSAYHIARGLKANGHGTLDCHDLWEAYAETYGFGYTSKTAAEENLKEFKHIISLKLSDAIGVDKEYEMIDILHVDLDNDGEILEKIVPEWIDKTRQLIIIEGGSAERDESDVATDYKKMPVTQWLADLSGREAKIMKGIIDKSDKTGRFVVIGGHPKHKNKPIGQWLKSLNSRRKDIEYFTLEPFPSITIIRKK